jgi:hypothetical protein
VQALLKDIPLGTKWADLTASTKAELRKHADNRLAAFRARWAGAALASKNAILLECPSAEMTAAIDDYYRKMYSAVVPQTFSLKDIKSAALGKALVGNYLGSMASSRAALTYSALGLKNFDWDGKSRFDSVRLPDKQTYEDIKSFSARTAADLRQIDDGSLDDLEKALKQQALFDARARALGSFRGDLVADAKGSPDLELACTIIPLRDDVLEGYADKTRPIIFADDDEVLREINAIYLHNTPLKWLDVGTFDSAMKYCDFSPDSDVVDSVGDPATNDVAKAIVLLKRWWIERVSANATQTSCTVYSADDRTQIWEAFTANLRFDNNGGSSMDTFRVQLERYRDGKLTQYRDTAKLALQQVFPTDTTLTPPQRREVLAAIETETAFGLFPGKIAAALDVAQGTTDGAAATLWRNALTANVVTVGGNYDPVRPDDETAIKAMFEEVKSWVTKELLNYPIDVASVLRTFQFTVTASNNSFTKIDNGNMSIGVGTKRSKMEYYSLLLHELRHAVAYAYRWAASDKSSVASDMGVAVEGSGVAAEAILLEPFLRQTLNNDLAYTLYALDYGIRDARYAGTTDATLQKYFQAGCSGAGEPDTIEFTKNIAVTYGLTEKLADNVAVRAHTGTQYFQYIFAGEAVLGDIAYLQSQIDSSGKKRVDPFVLFACGLNTPRRDMTYVAALKACMRL